MNLFITGFPGFIASRLLPRLVRERRFAKVFLLAERRLLEPAREAAAPLLGDQDFSVVAGDIVSPGLGLAGTPELQALLAEPSEWWHLAAIYRLEVPHRLAEQVNVEGTRNVLDIALQGRVEHFHYVSTAYVSGWRTGRVYEDELPEPYPENFKNFYELTKNAAEWLVRKERERLPTTIYRFGIVTGDSRTGETAKFDGPFFVIKYFREWRFLPLPWIGRMEARFNMVPVDYVVEATIALSRQDSSVGRCYHVVDPEPISTERLFREVARAVGVRPPFWRIPESLMHRVMKSRTVERLFGIPREGMIYLNHPVEYDCSNLQEALGEARIRCPRPEEYIPALVRFYEENRDRQELHLAVS